MITTFRNFLVFLSEEARIGVLLTASVLVLATAWELQAQEVGTAQEAFDHARMQLEGATLEDADYAMLRQVRDELDQLVETFPSSDIAVRVLFGETIDGLDVARLDQRLALGPEQAGISDGMAEAGMGLGEENGSVTDGLAAEVFHEPVLPQALPIAPVGRPVDLSKVAPELRALAGDLDQCYRRAQSNPGNTAASITFAVGEDGLLEGVPKLEEEEGASQEVRLMFLSAMIALESCAPYDLKHAGKQFTLTVQNGGLDNLEIVPQRGAEVEHRPYDIRDMQARLLVAGFDPNGIDGVAGPGFENAVERWQATNGFPLTGYMTEAQYFLLRQKTDRALYDWLSRSSKNRFLYHNRKGQLQYEAWGVPNERQLRDHAECGGKTDSKGQLYVDAKDLKSWESCLLSRGFGPYPAGAEYGLGDKALPAHRK